MIDWTADMNRTYEYWEVDPGTWKDVRPIDGVLSCEVTREDAGGDDDVLVSAAMETLSPLSGESYVRAYMSVEQPRGSRSRERECMDTFLLQPSSASYNGKRGGYSCTGYGPLVELRDDSPEDGYTVAPGADVRKAAAQICRAHCRAPVIAGDGDDKLSEPFVAEGDTWLSFVRALLGMASLKLSVDAYGRVAFAPDRDPAAMSPVWEYRDDIRSIMLPDVADECDWSGLPNKYVAVVSADDGCVVGTAVNDSAASPISTVSRGRVVLLRDDSPDLPKTASQALADAYARRKLREASRAEHEVGYTHLYCPVRLGEGVLVDYARAGFKARCKVTRQVIPHDAACKVAEAAQYTESYWR